MAVLSRAQAQQRADVAVISALAVGGYRSLRDLIVPLARLNLTARRGEAPSADA